MKSTVHLVAVGDSREEAEALYDRTVAILDREAARPPPRRGR